jgi:SAM-dependent methyltransferase
MTGAFGPSYAAAYDALYSEKDYEAECDFLVSAFAASSRRVRSVLDLGCGTGAHAIRLAGRGYDVVGVDISPSMLAIAKHGASEAEPGRSEFVLGDIRSVRLDRTFDAVIGMFAVLGYQTSDEDVRAALTTVRTHLAEGGPFVFDVWYGPAVEAIGPSSRSRVVVAGEAEIEREASAKLDRAAHLCDVSYRLITRRSGRPEESVDEVHRMRYFFGDELERFLLGAGLTPGELVPFPNTSATLSEAEWNVAEIATG